MFFFSNCITIYDLTGRTFVSFEGNFYFGCILGFFEEFWWIFFFFFLLYKVFRGKELAFIFTEGYKKWLCDYYLLFVKSFKTDDVTSLEILFENLECLL